MLKIYENNPTGYLLTPEEKELVNQTNREYEQMLFGEDEFMTCFDFQSDIQNWKWQSAAQIAELLNEEFQSLHITSTKIGKLLVKIEENNNMQFDRKTVHGKRLILCPPKSANNREVPTPKLPDYVSSVFQNITEDETVNF